MTIDNPPTEMTRPQGPQTIGMKGINDDQS